MEASSRSRGSSLRAAGVRVYVCLNASPREQDLDLERQGLSDSHPRVGIAIREIIPWAAVEHRLSEAGLIEDGA